MAQNTLMFKNLSIRATGTSYGYGVWFTNGAENNTIENCFVKSNVTSSSNGRTIYFIPGITSTIQ